MRRIGKTIIEKTSTVISGVVVKSKRNRKLQFRDKQVQISDRHFTGAQTFNFVAKFFLKFYIFLHKKNFDKKKIFRQTKI